MEKTIVLASGNEGKAREFRAILEPLGFKIVLQNDREGSEQIATDRLAVKITKQSTSKQHRCIRVI